MEPEESFGKVLRAVRKQRRLSQLKLALDADVERNYISLLELGRNSPSIRVVFKLCTVLGISPPEFFDRVVERIRRSQE